MSRRREPFAEVGQAARDSIERAIAAGGLNRLACAYLAVIHQTFTWSRLGDSVFGLRQLGDVARIRDDASHRNFRRELGRLEAAGAVFCERDSRGAIRWVSLVPSALRQAPLVAVVREQPGSDLTPSPGQIRPRHRVRSDPHTEKVDREGPTDVDADELDELLRPFGLTDRQRAEAHELIDQDDLDGARQVVHRVLAARDVRSPAAVLMSQLGAGAHRLPPKRTQPELGERWVRATGGIPDDDGRFDALATARYLRAEYGLPAGEVDRLVAIARELRAGGELQEAASG